MKVLFQSYNLCMQNDSGGIATKINALYKNLRKLGIEVKYFSKFNDKISNYDILHIFKANVENLSLIEYAKKSGVKVVISSVVPCADSFKIKANLLLCNLLPITTGIKIIQRSLDMSDAVIAETLSESRFLHKNYNINDEKIYIMPNGIDENFMKSEASNIIYDITNIDRRYILCVGRFDANKNQKNLIRALKDDDIPIIFIGGASPGHERYYNECKAIATKNMKFLGWVSHNDPILLSAYMNAHVLVAPSFYETFGINIIEGAYFGANVAISSRLPILDYNIFKEYTFNPKDVTDIRKVVTQAYNEDCNEGNKIKIKEIFSWESIAKEHLEVYKSLIGGE